MIVARCASCHDSPTSQNPQVKPNRNLNLHFDLHIPHMCLRTVLTQHILSKTAYATYADQGFACAKCSYDRALIKTSQKGFWGRSSDKPLSIRRAPPKETCSTDPPELQLARLVKPPPGIHQF